jgi:hypothetical protein
MRWWDVHWRVQKGARQPARSDYSLPVRGETTDKPGRVHRAPRSLAVVSVVTVARISPSIKSLRRSNTSKGNEHAICRSTVIDLPRQRSNGGYGELVEGAPICFMIPSTSTKDIEQVSADLNRLARGLIAARWISDLPSCRTQSQTNMLDSPAVGPMVTSPPAGSVDSEVKWSSTSRT